MPPEQHGCNYRQGHRWAIIDALRRYGTDSSRLGHAFAGLHQLQPADLCALVAIMSAEGNGAPLTAGQLREHLGLSSGGASLVIDRLERAGHIRRARDHPPTTASSTSATPTRAGLPVSPSLARSATAPTPS
jgi:MarR family protein